LHVCTHFEYSPDHAIAGMKRILNPVVPVAARLKLAPENDAFGSRADERTLRFDENLIRLRLCTGFNGVST
jgi:hypothetical protein